MMRAVVLLVFIALLAAVIQVGVRESVGESMGTHPAKCL